MSESLLALILALGCGAGIGLSVWMRKYIERHPRKNIAPNNGDSPGEMGTMNGIGISLIGSFDTGKSFSMGNISYLFFTVFYIPIIPLGCYNTRMTGMSRKSYKQSSTSYSFYGSQPWRFLEVLYLYSIYYSIIGTIVCTIWFFTTLS